MRVSLLTHRVSKRFHMRRSWIYLGPFRRSRTHRRSILCDHLRLCQADAEENLSLCGDCSKSTGVVKPVEVPHTRQRGADFFGTHPWF
jgi:hypothetical protein